MPKNKRNVPKQLRLGKRGNSSEAKPPTGTGAGGRIDIKFQEIKWTPRKLTITITLLSIPYLAATAISFMAGNNLVGFIFLGLGVFVVGIYLLLRYIERGDL